ncbi:MAG: glutathione S-transferase family protein [Nevskiaceae bacterium]|nr:MAG: glutathione S-transferase family protein [Nevskiaceae bacterium]TBR71413.1 MAG: glutathione S-transferase family protein [Nevskiaceae bacterium]
MTDTSPLRLHGHAVSNYFDAVHAALIEKKVDFELVGTRASGSAEFLAMNPMGKIPVLETPSGYIAETVAILEYLEDTIPVPALYPRDAFQRARTRQIMNVVQCYIEAPARSLYPGVFMGATNSAAVVNTAQLTIDRGGRALAGLAEFRPYLVGKSITNADIFSFYCLNLVDRLTRAVYRWSIIDKINGLRGWFNTIAERDSSRAVIADFKIGFRAYLDEKNIDRADLEGD